MKRLTGAADKDGFCAKARIEIVSGRPGTMDVLVHPAPSARGTVIPAGGVAEILEAALVIARREQRGRG